MCLLSLGYGGYPSCVERDFFVKGPEPAKVSVVDFIAVGAVGENCETDDCLSTSTFRGTSPNACALICFRSDECTWWSAVQTFSGFLNRTVCHLYNTANENSVGGLRISNTSSGHKFCSPSIWPGCVEKHTAVQPIGFVELWINATHLFGAPVNDRGCTDNNCYITDRFRIESPEACATSCTVAPGCKYWTFGGSDGIQMCWLRRWTFKMEEKPGFISGNIECALNSPFRKP
jgi:hypothetical protein